MPRDIDVVGVWHGTPYQVASLSSRQRGDRRLRSDGQADAVIVVTKQSATAHRLFRRYAPNVLVWTVPADA